MSSPIVLGNQGFLPCVTELESCGFSPLTFFKILDVNGPNSGLYYMYTYFSLQMKAMAKMSSHKFSVRDTATVGMK